MERIILFMRNRESAFVFRRRVHSEVLWEFLTEAETLIFVVKATPIILKPRPNDRNIVGCNMLWAFGHPVATHRNTVAKRTQHMLRCCDMLGWHVAIGLTSMPLWNSILFMRIVNRYLERQQLFFGGATKSRARKRFSLKELFVNVTVNKWSG